MATQLQLRKGTATQHNTFTGADGEVTVDTTNKTLRVHDGTTVGGTQLATLGISQTWQNMTASRVLATTYTNSTSRAIVVCVTGYTAAGNKLSGTVNGSVVQSFRGFSSGLTSTVTLNVPPNGTYSVTGAMEAWWELR